MEECHKLGLYISYYLARFDHDAYNNLGFGNQLETHNKIGEILLINPHTIKNWRDEFDPVFGHRAGWYQRPMSPSRVRIVQALENLEESQIREIVKDIISGRIQNEEDDLEQLLNIVTTDDDKKKTSIFILRSPTGRLAEEFYLKHFAENKKPFDGELIDCRDLGVGYDFKIETQNGFVYIEVKGLSAFSGGILLTSKEWEVAKAKDMNYFLCLVSNLSEKPKVTFIQNPAGKLYPKRNITTMIQISWSITEKQLAEIND
jgi:hypothetical protein